MSFRKVTAFLCAALLLTGFVFAGGGKDKTSSDGRIVLKVLDYQDSTAPNSFDDNAIVWEAFEKANPDIILQREVLFNEPFHQKSAAYAASGNMPDVFYMWPGGRSTAIHTAKLAKDLKPLLEKDGLLNKYSPLRTEAKHSTRRRCASKAFGASRTIKFAGLPSSKPYTSSSCINFAPL